ncbi:hypothetical protein DKX38_004405 [Salix brachista]|uniref:Uncharacterized protein n=1 Tax=Salix brachista TaxID=2182728 RepID=A0A5N5ND20_9ROSI|nr:hypothetical protein DKX38_004405 [Salix brachista]
MVGKKFPNYLLRLVSRIYQCMPRLCCAIEDFVEVSGGDATQLSDSHHQLPISGPEPLETPKIGVIYSAISAIGRLYFATSVNFARFYVLGFLFIEAGLDWVDALNGRIRNPTLSGPSLGHRLLR